MKLKVEQVFVDKYDSTKVYAPGEQIDISEESRAESLIARGLCSAVEDSDNVGKKSAAEKKPAEASVKSENPGKKKSEKK